MARKEKKPKKRGKTKNGFVVIEPRSAGIDVGSRRHYVCAPALNGDDLEVKDFGTTTPELQDLVDWLLARGVVTVAMESTGVYWISLHEILEEKGLSVVLANARQLQKVPGRKTDVLDCQWIQRLHSCGLLRGSFRPSDEVCRVRALVRQAANFAEARGKALQWIQKALDQMNVAVHRAVSDISGVTGMRIVRAIVEGERDPAVLAKLRDARCRHSEKEIANFLTGNWREDHLFNLTEALAHYDALCATVARYELQLNDLLGNMKKDDDDSSDPIHPKKTKEATIQRKGEAPLRNALFRFSGVDLTRIDGISTGNALAILSEVGPDLAKFPTEGDFVSWMRLCPRNAITGGKVIKKRKTGETGATRAGQAMRSAAVSVRNSKSALGAEYRRIARRKGAGVAVFAVARKIAVLVYRMLRYGQDYVDIGAEAYERTYQERRLQNLLRQADELGCTLVPKVKPA